MITKVTYNWFYCTDKEYGDECYSHEVDEQEATIDFTADNEKCECGAYINSDNRCPSCDY